MNIKLIALDIDRTLIDIPTLNHVPNPVRTAIKDAEKKGIKFCICTARPYAMVSDIMAEIEVYDLLICCNGAHVLKNNEDHKSLEIPSTVVSTCIRYIMDNDINALFARERYYTRISLINRNRSIESGKDDGYYSEISDQDLTQIIRDKKPIYQIILAPGDEDDIDVFDQQLRSALSNHFDEITIARQYSADYFVITHKLANKGTALLSLAKDLHIKPEEIMAIGDDEVDIPMLQCAGLGIAVENAMESVKKIADFIVPSVHDDGVAHAIYRFAM